MAEFKTNVMRTLDKKNIKYIPHSYPVNDDTPIDGVSVASYIKKDAASVYKTLVCESASKKHYVFVIPVAAQLDFKKCAKSEGEKMVEMIKQKELLPLTGYVHGGCSPIGMKKPFKTFFHKDVLSLPTVTVSAGKVGYQIELEPQTLIGFIGAMTADLVV
ncbi:MAG: Cys-tRNA(Pro) deacylase [Clostridia bacterium]|nr:Cys-tRNA(Pro) deacylase [Clostridia bacterium]